MRGIETTPFADPWCRRSKNGLRRLTAWHNWSSSVLRSLLPDKVSIMRKLCKGGVDEAVLLYRILRRCDKCPSHKKPVQVWCSLHQGHDLRQIEVVAYPDVFDFFDQMG